MEAFGHESSWAGNPVVMWVVYAAASGRNIKQRLTDPHAIDQVPAELKTAAAH